MRRVAEAIRAPPLLASGALVAALALAGPTALGAPARGSSGPTGLIAFDRALDGGGRIYAIGARGTGLRELSRETGSLRPVWSPDGASVAYANGGEVSSTDVHVLSLGGTVRRLTRRAGSEGRPAWSARGRRIAYVAMAPAAGPEVWVVDASGRRPRRLARGATLPAWSPDGRRIAWVSAGTGAIEVAAAHGGPARRLPGVRVSGGPSAPAWSPDGRRLAAVDRDGRLIVVDACTGRTTRLTTGTGADAAAYPEWSPGGSRVAVLLGPRAELTVIDANGSGRRRLARTDGLGAPSWSPDGRFMAYSDPGHHLAVAGLDGWGPRLLTRGAVGDDDPAWRPRAVRSAHGSA